jgi:mannose-1-phosphate guanylyltransferase
MLSAIVLSAGFGTRLRPLTDALPKPLMPVGDRPILAHAVEKLRRSRIGRVVANTFHLATELEREINRLKLEVDLVREPKILGTAGAVSYAGAALGEGPVLVWNGDIVAPDLDVGELATCFASASAEALWVVEPAPVGAGTVGLDDDGFVVRLRGESFGRETLGGEYIGVQVLSPALRALLPTEGCLVADVALPLLRRGGKIASMAYRQAWDDVGQPAALLRANLRWLERRGLASWVAPDAEVAPGVRLERAVVGGGARLQGAGVVRDSVIFPGAEVYAPIERALVSAAHCVPV